MNVYLIGMPGSGKSTIGKLLSERLGRTFVDLDHMIERDAMMFIDEMFEKYGEQTFREYETKALEAVSKCEDLVVSTGGGIVTEKRNKALMQGIVIYIDTEIEIIEERIKTDFPRPLLRKKTLVAIKDERMLKYIFFADVIIANDDDAEKAVTQILKKLAVLSV